MANIVNPPARINRNTAADGDFLWKQDFEVLYNNDVALEQAIQQASQDYTAGDGISIDPSTKTISVNTGTGIKKDDKGLSVNIEGKNIDVQYAEGKYTLSAFDSQEAFNELEQYVEDIDDELKEAEQRFITSDNVTQENTQYVYTTSGWKAIAGGEHQELAYWRPYFDSSDNKIKWYQEPSTDLDPPDDSVSLKGPKGDDGKTPEFKVDQNTNFWEWKYTDESQSEWRSTNTSATGPRGAKGDQGDKGYTPEISTDIDTEHSGTKVTFSWPESSQLQPTEFIIPSGTPGAPGINGTNGASGKTPQLQINSTTNYWEVSYDDGGTWTSLNVKATGPAGAPGFDPVITTSIIAPDPSNPNHKNGGTKIIISNKTGTPAEASAWNGENGKDGDAGNAEGYITGTGTAANPFVLTDEAIEAIETVSGKMVPPAKDTGANTQYKLWGANYDSQTSGWQDAKSLVSTWCAEWGYDDYVTSAGLANNKNWVLSTDNQGKSQWIEANYATEDWLDDHYLPLSGGTVSGETVISGNSNFDNSNLKFIRESQTNIGRIGINQSGGLTIKSSDSSNNNYTQINISPTGDNDKRIALQKMVNNARSDIGYLIPADINTSVPEGGFSNDGILHIVVES